MHKVTWRAPGAMLLLLAAAGYGQMKEPEHSVAAYNVSWSSPGTNENDSMPLGNGDLAANVWTEQNGDLVLLLAKSDAYTETGKLVKLGRVRLHLSPGVLTAGEFEQTLRLDRGDIEIHAGESTVRIWIDANHPAVHVEVHAAVPAALAVTLETWRTTHAMDNSPDSAGMNELGAGTYPVEFHADTVLPESSRSITWYHDNEQSIYPTAMEQEHLGSLVAKYPDPLLHRCFGATITGPGLKATSDKSLASEAPDRNLRVDIVALAQEPASSSAAFLSALNTAAGTSNPQSLEALWAAHQAWWTAFWDRSWIDVSGDEAARAVAQGYAMQRYMMAAESRGTLPVKFNGGLFTVGHDMAPGAQSSKDDHNPDYRAWGNSYWNQNNRLLYWPLLESGDYDLIKPWFDMYLHDLPLAIDRTKLYYHHGGASLPETMFFWGIPNLHDFGWDNPSYQLQSRWQRYHIQGTLEVISQMLDYYDDTGDEDFARTSLVPFADAILTYYDQHYPRGSDGKMVMVPAQSLETYQLVAVTPTPDLAGLKSVLPRMMALPTGVVSAEQVAAWKKLLDCLPEITVGRTTAAGKTPPMGVGDPQGTPVILPAAQYGKTGNSENPELYVSFPYRLYGVGKPDLKLAQDTYAARRFPQDTCWGQDGTEAAVLGLTEEARRAAIAEFTDYGNQRFKWFWKPGHDWIPDLDNGGDGMITLEEMLMQTDGRKILLLPAWPKDWTADFKLHAPANTVVEGHVEDGKLTRLKVTPSARAQDVMVEGH